MTPRSPRALALAALREWRTSERFADSIVHRRLLQTALAGPDRAFTTDLVFGVVRNLTLLDYWIAMLRLGKVDHESRDVLRLGLYQLLILNSAEHAAVFETVAIADPRARGLVNAILRSTQTRRDELVQARDAAPVATRFSHPQMIVDRWTEHFGATDAATLCKWDNEPPPIYARVNQLKISPRDFATSCAGAEPVSGFPNLFRLRELPTESLDRGDCYIQDPSTTLACQLLDPQPGETVLDACAAPGGKACDLAERMQNCGSLVATDRDRSRLVTLRQNLARLGVENAEVVECDWTHDRPLPESIADRSYDRILVDAPCTNTGVMRRRVDVRWRLSAGDFGRLQSQQRAILRRVAPLLKPAGVLVYSTCSIEPEENETVVQAFADEVGFVGRGEQMATLPFRDGIDGAFATRFDRVG
ncbi:MAG: 16S rRNA (cytosine(967)-C(5))-methyltransferase RsmB [Verrucomicrobiota bacterium]|nr:16S rRNA (cytosine(967)-C(5))-methyltransferase RsmB [Verrucomicrobiota bacterium]